MNRLNYREQGSGPTVILLHGFPLNLQIWDDFAEKLSEWFQVVTPDLPGFGKSPNPDEGFSLADIATTVHDWMRAKAYTRPVVIGHSLGGYITLALAKQDDDLPAGICLFHSTALADTQEKKASRNKVLEFIERQGVQAFTSNYISQLYADPQHSSITKTKSIAVQASKETVMGYTRAMRDREDRTDVVKIFARPILFLAGEKDPGIPVDSVLQQAALNGQAEALILPEVAHMGMFESEVPCLKKIKGFIEKCQVTF